MSGFGSVENLWITRLEYRNVPGAGFQIYAHFSDGVERQMIEQGPHLFAYEPWRQFPPSGLKEIMDTLFAQMVEAWNEKHGG